MTRRPSLEHWLTQTLPMVGLIEPKSIHVTELDGSPDGIVGTPASLDDVLALLERIVDIMGEHTSTIEPVVCLALPTSMTLDGSMRTIDEYLDEHAGEGEPASIGLVSRAASLLPPQWEAYVLPLFDMAISTPSGRRGHVHAVYRCYRWDEARRANWEYARALYFEFYSDQPESGVTSNSTDTRNCNPQPGSLAK